MKSVSKIFKIIGVVMALGLMAYVIVSYYPWIFSKTVKGKIEKVERVDMNLAVLGAVPQEKLNPQLHTYAVAILTEDGTIETASSEDNRWAVAQAGQCVEAKFFPYPPWRIDRSGTYFGARLMKLSECGQK